METLKERKKERKRERKKEKERERKGSEYSFILLMRFLRMEDTNCIGLISRRKYLISDYRCKRTMYRKKEKKDKKKI